MNVEQLLLVAETVVLSLAYVTGLFMILVGVAAYGHWKNGR